MTYKVTISLGGYFTLTPSFEGNFSARNLVAKNYRLVTISCGENPESLSHLGLVRCRDVTTIASTRLALRAVARKRNLSCAGHTSTLKTKQDCLQKLSDTVKAYSLTTTGVSRPYMNGIEHAGYPSQTG